MKKYIFASLLLITSLAFPAEEKKQETQKPKEKEKITPLTISKNIQKSIMILNPKERAEDYVKAFEMLKKNKPSSKIYFRLSSNKIINNIIDMNMLENGSLILFKTSSTKGTNFLIVPTEEIESVGHLWHSI